MKKLIFKLGIILVLGAILCSCASRPSGSTSKPSAKEDTFTPSTLEGLDKKTASYESYKKAAQSAFASLVPTSADEFEYSECEGGVSIDRHIGDSELVVLPSEINGKTVVKIAAEAFYIEDNKDTEEIEASRVRSVYVPDSVVSIGKGAFKNCTSLLLI